MGHKKSIIAQAYDKLDALYEPGRDKHWDKMQDPHHQPRQDKIYSSGTLKTYRQQVKKFARWARDTHNCRNIEEARKYAPDYIEYLKGRTVVDYNGLRVEGAAREYKANSINLAISAISKMYGASSYTIGKRRPRHRADTSQHRDPDKWASFKAEKHKDLVDFCKATGLRRMEVSRLRPKQVVQHRDGTVWLHKVKGKGGRIRSFPVRLELADRVLAISVAAAARGQKKVFDYIPVNAPIHRYRAEYARAMYDAAARPLIDLPEKELYRCRKDKYGDVYDRQAMLIVSRYLGHSRVDIMAQSYLYLDASDAELLAAENEA